MSGRRKTFYLICSFAIFASLVTSLANFLRLRLTFGFAQESVAIVEDAVQVIEKFQEEQSKIPSHASVLYAFARKYEMPLTRVTRWAERLDYRSFGDKFFLSVHEPWNGHQEVIAWGATNARPHHEIKSPSGKNLAWIELDQTIGARILLLASPEWVKKPQQSSPELSMIDRLKVDDFAWDSRGTKVYVISDEGADYALLSYDLTAKTLERVENDLLSLTQKQRGPHLRMTFILGENNESLLLHNENTQQGLEQGATVCELDGKNCAPYTLTKEFSRRMRERDQVREKYPVFADHALSLHEKIEKVQQLLGDQGDQIPFASLMLWDLSLWYRDLSFEAEVKSAPTAESLKAFSREILQGLSVSRTAQRWLKIEATHLLDDEKEWRKAKKLFEN